MGRRLLLRQQPHIAEKSEWLGESSLETLFSDYFSGSETTFWNLQGVGPDTGWVAAHAEIIGGYNVAAMQHNLTTFGTVKGGITLSVLGNTNFGSGLVDFGNDSQYRKAVGSGDNVSFELASYWQGNNTYTWSSVPADNKDEMVHMLGFDVTDLYNSKNETDFDSVWMLAWEYLALTPFNGGSAADWDYQDMVVFMTNITPNNPSATPEPATLAVLGLGLAGLGLISRRRKK